MKHIAKKAITPLAGQLPFTDFPVYGIVTDGIFWQFGRLLGDTFTQVVNGQ